MRYVDQTFKASISSIPKLCRTNFFGSKGKQLRICQWEIAR